jgi:hypothetical protein
MNLGTIVDMVYSEKEALEVVVGYCFGRRNDDPPQDSFIFAYRSYDCALRSSDTRLTEQDIFASVGLNSGITARTILRLLALVDSDANPTALASNPDFWTLDPSRLRDEAAASGHPEDVLWRAWRQLRSIGDVAGAVASKILHHRWPEKYPLYDSKIAEAYHSTRTWSEICEDLKSNSEEFARLEERFEAYRVTFESDRTVPLCRVRLLDILVWTEQAGHRLQCKQLGESLLGGEKAS